MMLSHYTPNVRAPITNVAIATTQRADEIITETHACVRFSVGSGIGAVCVWGNTKRTHKRRTHAARVRVWDASHRTDSTADTVTASNNKLARIP